MRPQHKEHALALSKLKLEFESNFAVGLNGLVENIITDAFPYIENLQVSFNYSTMETAIDWTSNRPSGYELKEVMDTINDVLKFKDLKQF